LVKRAVGHESRCRNANDLEAGVSKRSEDADWLMGDGGDDDDMNRSASAWADG
jgi:hypothetical protein